MEDLPKSDSVSHAAPAVGSSELRCPGCDYDLRALHSDRCPECGLMIDRANLAVSQVPWTHREQMGRWQAFRRTVWLTFRRPKRIAADVARPVSLDDAKKFQRIVLILTFVPILAIGLWGYSDWLNGRIGEKTGRPYLPPISLSVRPTVAPRFQSLGWAMEGVGVIGAAVCVWLFLKAATGVCSYFFHPGGLSIPRQNRAVALSYYACAPLAWTPVSALILAALALFANSRWGGESRYERIGQLLGCLVILTLAVQIVAWWRCSLILLKNATRCSGLRVLAVAVALPILWLLMAVVVMIPLAAYTFVCVVILSLLRAS